MHIHAGWAQIVRDCSESLPRLRMHAVPHFQGKTESTYIDDIIHLLHVYIELHIEAYIYSIVY